MNLKEKKQNLESLLQNRISELQRLETARNQLAEQVIEIRGKLNLIKELELENGTGKSRSVNTPGGTNQKSEGE